MVNVVRLAAATLALLAFGCSSKSDAPIVPEAKPKLVAATNAVPASTPEPAAPFHGDPQKGGELVLKFECNRCHEGTGHAAMAFEQHCVACHESISTGKFGAGTPKIAEWKQRVSPYRYAPSLENAGKRFRPEWLARFIQDPKDLRPHLEASMPRLAVTAEQANDLAAYLTRNAPPTGPDALAAGNLERGRALVEAKGCGGCHEFTGVPSLPTTPSDKVTPEARRKGVLLAPDLRHARDRFRPDALVTWLLDPPATKPGTSMPTHGFTREEATDVAAYVTKTELAPAPKTDVPPRLPVLARTVTYREVEARVLSVTCRHCHGDPDVAGGDGGPGNTGGFGFEPRRLDLSTYSSAGSGYVADDHQRHSVFEKTKDGTPLLVAALDARRHEEAGQTVSGVRGMPLGLPAVSREDIQLVESWIASGRPR